MGDFGTAEIGALLGAAGVVLFLIAARRGTLLGGLAALAVAEGLLVSTAIALRPALLGIGLAAAVVLAGGAHLFVRHPALVTPAVLAAAPFRVPFEFDTSNRFFLAFADGGELGRLLPLYAVLGAGAFALAWRVARGDTVAQLPRAISLPTAAFLALACLSLLWGLRVKPGVDLLAYFLVPFAVLLGTVGRAPFPRWMPRALGVIAVALASVFAVVGLYEAATQKVLFGAQAVDASNAFRAFFRVTSLFRDPSIYGRHLVLALIVVVATLLFTRLDVRLGAAVVALLGAALFFTYSQSSMVALFVAVLALLLAITPSRLRISLAVVAVALVAVTAVAVAAEVRDESARRATSGRTTKIEDAARVVADRPVVGAGIGSQPVASRRLAERAAGTNAFVSHTTPLTVGAELGILGLALYFTLLGGAGWTIEQVRRREEVLGLILGTALLALFVHALFYSGFFEDPLTWFVLAVASGFLVSGPPDPRTAEQ